jgi:hypothetical protein
MSLAKDDQSESHGNFWAAVAENSSMWRQPPGIPIASMFSDDVQRDDQANGAAVKPTLE